MQALIDRLDRLLQRLLTGMRSYTYVYGEYATVQTATELVAAPGAGKRIVIKGYSIQTADNAGTAYLHAGTGETLTKIGMVYAARFQMIAQGNVSIALPANTALSVTTVGTTTNAVFVAVQYTTEEVG